MKTQTRKNEHIDICLHEDVSSAGISTGLEKYVFRHQALPEIAFEDVSLQCEWLGRTMKAPLLISSMTGGTQEAYLINRRIARAAQLRGWGMGIGSMRAAIENESLAETFNVRKDAPDIPLIANMGAVQLNYGYGVDHCLRAVELSEADALVFHLNSMQEVFQPEGDTNFKNLLHQLEKVCRALQVPVGFKEVGWGIDGELAERLADAGASFIDVAGAGGTSWIQVEKFRNHNPIQVQAAEAFAGWGIPTAECLRDIRNTVKRPMTVIASGGLSNGVEAAKAIALGADLAGFGRSVLQYACDSEESLSELFERIEFELRAAMFGIGVEQIGQLQRTNRIRRRE